MSTLSIQYEGGTLVMCKPPGRTRGLLLMPELLPSTRPAVAAMLALTAAAMSAVDRGAAASWSRDLSKSRHVTSCHIYVDHHAGHATSFGESLHV